MAWLPGAADVREALKRLGFRSPAPRAYLRDVLKVVAPAPPGTAAPDLQSPIASTLGASPSPLSTSAQRPRRGRRGAAEPAAPTVPLLNLQLLLRGVTAVLRRGKVGGQLDTLHPAE